MSLPVHIFVRTNTPWEMMSFEDFCAQDRKLLTPMAAQEACRKGGLIRQWEAAYGLPFCQYRRDVRSACEGVLRGIGAPVSKGPDEIAALLEGPDSWVFPIDDDDTFDPSILSLAERARDDQQVITWNRRTNFLGKDRVEDNGLYTDTCNYAVRSSFLASLGDSHAVTVLLFHWLAAGKIAQAFGLMPPPPRTLIERARRASVFRALCPLAHPAVMHVSEAHSTYYLHTGSISFLVGGKMGVHGDTVEYLRSLPLHPLYTGRRLQCAS